ncbi:MAG TPA: energy coupling factor transporter S component ThiW [Patescibacteria group bacterium]|nr:energy coupling factor transporter S component ThiW [Patescibacteria group bacterium]
MNLQKMTFAALFVAIGVLSAHLIYIPVGIAKCFPVQHAINILLAVLLGTRYSVGAAFSISLLRNVLGTGSLLAFPGSLFGAALAGILYRRTNHILGAIAGEVIGTGIIGSLVAFPAAKFLLGSSAGAFFFVAPFLVSTTGGSLLAYALYKTPVGTYFKESVRK